MKNILFLTLNEKELAPLPFDEPVVRRHKIWFRYLQEYGWHSFSACPADLQYTEVLGALNEDCKFHIDRFLNYIKHKAIRDAQNILISVPVPVFTWTAIEIKKIMDIPIIMDIIEEPKTDLLQEKVGPDWANFVDYFLFVSEFALERSFLHMPPIPEEKTGVVADSFDLQEISTIKPEHNGEKFTITCVDRIPSNPCFISLCCAIRKAKQESEYFARDVRFRFFFPVGVKMEKDFLKGIIEDEPSIADVAECHIKEYEYFEDRGVEMESDLLLVLHYKDCSDSSAAYARQRLIDYLGMKKPVLGILDDRELSEIIIYERLGAVASCNSVESIKEALLYCYNLWKEGRWSFCTAPRRWGYFSAGYQTKQLVNILNELSEKRKARQT